MERQDHPTKDLMDAEAPPSLHLLQGDGESRIIILSLTPSTLADSLIPHPSSQCVAPRVSTPHSMGMRPIALWLNKDFLAMAQRGA
jgi:hypothetical protein